MNAPFTHGQEVMVFDARGNLEFRGRVRGVHESDPWRYDIMPDGHSSMKALKPGIPHHQVKAVPRPVLAYERRNDEPRHILDNA